MSATGRTEGLREQDDFYETPAWATRAILPHLERVPTEEGPRVILDPFAGRGAILEVVRDDWGLSGKGPIRFGIELDEGRAREAAAFAALDEVTCGDALAPSIPWPRAHLVLTNPPYKHAERAIRRAHAEVVVRGGEAAFLLRVNFLGSEKRAAFHRQFPSDVFILPRRPSFAISWKCVYRQCANGLVGLRSDGTPMGVVPKVCIGCGGQIRKSSSDATEYAWFVWGPMRGGRWSILNVEG